MSAPGKSNFIGSVSRSLQVARQIESEIANGQLPPGAPLRSVRELAAAFEVSSSVISDAVDILAGKKLVKRYPRRGVFVSSELNKRRLLVISDTHSNEASPHYQIMPHLNEAASQQDILLEICDLTEFSHLTPEMARQFVRGNNFIGVILFANSFNGTEPVINLLKYVQIPVVITPGNQRDSAITGFACVTEDDRNGWKCALQHLKHQGYNRILTATFLSGDNKIRTFSFAEYRTLLRELGLDDAEKWIQCLPMLDYQALGDMLRSIYRQSTDFPQAILCSSDFLAVHVYQVLRELNLRIPEDVAVMGYCGALIGRTLQPQLSTIEVGYAAMGGEALRLILEAAKWFDPQYRATVPQIVVPYRLIAAASTVATPVLQVVNH